MTTDLVYIAVSLFLLFVGAECLVNGSASLALRCGLSPLMVGVTVVAFGTSAPELVVSVKAALSLHGDVSVGNVVGSNSFNIGIILGLTALLCPIPVNRQIIRIDAPIALGVALILPFFLANDVIGRLEGMLLFSGIVVYTCLSFMLGDRSDNVDTGDVSVSPVSRNWFFDIAYIAGGIAVLVLGSRILVEHSVLFAKALGVSEAVIGLTVIAAGTSMPEFVTSLVAAVRREPDIAIGNVVGSNIFNILGILGMASLIAPIHAPGISLFDYGVMLAFTVLLIPLLYTGKKLHRIEGGVLLGLYGVYMAILWPR